VAKSGGSAATTFRGGAVKSGTGMTSAAESETSGSEVRTPEWGWGITGCLDRLGAAPACGTPCSCGRPAGVVEHSSTRTVARQQRAAGIPILIPQSLFQS